MLLHFCLRYESLTHLLKSQSLQAAEVIFNHFIRDFAAAIAGPWLGAFKHWIRSHFAVWKNL